jgi:hypothetical protein
MPAKLDLTGQRFGRLLALRASAVRRGSRTFWECVCDCGSEATRSTKLLRNGDSASCGCLHIERAMRHVKSNTKPLGHERTNKRGYVLVKTERGYVRKHVHVMEAHLGRKLLPDEDVHHDDEDKANNAIGNLILMSHAEHTIHHNKVRSSNVIT